MSTAIPDKTLLQLDETLERLSSRQLSDVLKAVPGMRWTDELPLPHYDRLDGSSSSGYLSHAWSLPARQAWLSIRQKPRLSILEALALRVPGAWAWRADTPQHLQPAVWAGAAFIRDTRQKAPKVLAEILTQALDGAQTPQERADRAAAIMGGGWSLATRLLGHWGPAGWDATRTWGPFQVGLLNVLLDPQGSRRARDNPWHRWSEAADLVATSAPEAAQWCELALAGAMGSWLPIVELSGKKLAQETFSQSVLDTLDTIDPWSVPAHVWSDPVRASLESLVMGILCAEQHRGPSLVQGRNFHVLGVALSCLMDQPSVDVEFARKVSDLLPSLPDKNDFASRQALSSLRAYSLKYVLRSVASLPSPPSSPGVRPKM